uniref:EGF-like domain-containing protein n=1 Tax=Haemonchus contortus TaxID=6289 RepID=A0A7I4YL29_HAECO
MMLKLALIFLSVLELLTITDGSVRSGPNRRSWRGQERRRFGYHMSGYEKPTFEVATIRDDPVIIASILNCDPVGTWLRHRHRCICRPHFYGLRCERIHRCVSGRPRNVSCSYPEIEHMAAVKARCLPGTDEMIEICECFDGYCGPLCEQQIQQKPLSLRLPPRRTEPVMEFLPYSGEDSEEEAYHDDDYSFWTPDNSHWIVFILLHFVLVVIALTAVAVTVVCYLRRKKTNYYVINEFSKTSRPHAEEDCDKPSLPPSYDEIVNEVDVANENVQERPEGLPDYPTLVINCEGRQPYLHV